MISFRVALVPPKTNHQRKKIVRVGKFLRLADKPELVDAKELLDSVLIRHQPNMPVPGPVVLRLEFTWPWLKSHGPRLRALGRIPHTSKPDLTNVAKTLEDRLVALRFIEDDRGVQNIQILKWWGNNPGIHISIRPFDARDAADALDLFTNADNADLTSRHNAIACPVCNPKGLRFSE